MAGSWHCFTNINKKDIACKNIYIYTVYIYILTDRQTDRQTARQTDRQTDRQIDRQIDRYTYECTCIL